GETNGVIDFPPPENTTFQSRTEPAGATCTTLPVGGTGTINCPFTAPVAPGATGSFTVTVNVNAAATGQIFLDNYDIHSTQQTLLLGNKVTTTAGCTQDSHCSAGDWCNETAGACTPQLANGTAIPNDPPHVNPILNGTCTAAAGKLVCASGVCDTADNRCGYADGHGTCTPANGGTVCRSGACSVNGKCEPAGGCNVDADCPGGLVCIASTCVAPTPTQTPTG